MKLRIFAMLLCLVLLVGALAACAQSGNEQQATQATEQEEQWVSASLDPSKLSTELAGQEIVILANCEYDIGPEENSSEPLEDAVYKRNDKLETFYGFKFNNSYDTSFDNIALAVKNDTAAGTGEYNIVYQHMVNAAYNLALNGYLYDLSQLEYVDFDQIWWDQDCKNGFTIGEHMMLTCGDLIPSTQLITGSVLFNKQLFDERDWEYPYEDARQGKWTMDDMYGMTKEQAKDLNGDSRMHYADDFFGITCWSLDCDYNFFYGAGASMFTYDSEHVPSFAPDADRLQSIYEKIYQMLITKDTYHLTYNEYLKDNNLYFTTIEVFRDGRALFFPTNLSVTVNLRDMEDDYGILPQPKYDETQKDYLGFVNGSASMAVVPVSQSEEQLEITGFMLEALASSSYYMVTDTLYEVVAKSKHARDPESAEMVDVIIRHKVFDFGYSHFSHKNLPCSNIVMVALQENRTSIVRDITSSEKNTRKELKKILEAYGYDD